MRTHNINVTTTINNPKIHNEVDVQHQKEVQLIKNEIELTKMKVYNAIASTVMNIGYVVILLSMLMVSLAIIINAYNWLFID